MKYLKIALGLFIAFAPAVIFGEQVRNSSYAFQTFFGFALWFGWPAFVAWIYGIVND